MRVTLFIDFIIKQECFAKIKIIVFLSCLQQLKNKGQMISSPMTNVCLCMTFERYNTVLG